MAFGPEGVLSASASGAEGGAVSLALGDSLVVLNTDLGCTAVAVDGVVLAVAYVAGNTGGLVVKLLIVHNEPPYNSLRFYYFSRKLLYSSGRKILNGIILHW